MIAPRSSEPSIGRLVEVWSGGTDRDPSAVVAEHRERAPAWLRSRIRPMTRAERDLWRYIGDVAWMRTAVFSQVPLYVPEIDRGWVLGFLVPARAIAIEVVALPPGKSIEHLADFYEQDQLLLDRAQIATMRCLEQAVLKDPKGSAESIRWTLGFGDKENDGFFGINIPR